MSNELDEKNLEIKKLIEKINLNNGCNSDYKCLEKNNSICKAKDYGLGTHAICLEDNYECNRSINYGNKYFCNCPIRVYIAKNQD